MGYSRDRNEIAGGCQRLLVAPIRIIIATRKLISKAQPQAMNAAAIRQPGPLDRGIEDVLAGSIATRRPVTSTNRPLAKLAAKALKWKMVNSAPITV